MVDGVQYCTVLCKMPRRNRISLEKRERIIRAFEDTNEDYLMVADTIGVNRSTARSIVARYIQYVKVKSLKDHVEVPTMFVLTMK